MRNSRRRFFRWNKILAIPLFLGIILTWLLWPQKETVAGWFDESWAYRTALTIGNTGSADGNKKVKFDIDTSTLVTAGKIQSDCGDSRFTDISGKPLKYYIDSAGGACNTASTDYYVLIPVINSGSTTIYHYYGNSSAPNGTEAAQFTQSTFTPTSGPSTATEENGIAPISYWKFDEGSGSTTYDSNQNSISGTITNAVWKTGDECISGKCLYFDGSGDYVSIGNISNYKIDTKTVSFWAKPIAIGGTYIIMGNGGANWYVAFSSTNKIFTSYTNGSSSQTTFGSSNNTVTLNEWHYFSYVYSVSGSNVTISLYKDAQLVTTTTNATGYGTNYGSNFIFGALNSSANFFNGYLDEVKIYNYARSATQIQTDYIQSSSSRGSGSSFGVNRNQSGLNLANGLIGWWKMDENTGTTISDYSGNAYTSSTFTGNTTWTTGKYSMGLTFDGTDDVVVIPVATGSGADLGSTTDSYTISAWIKTTQNSSTTATIVGKDTGGGAYPFWLVMNASNLGCIVDFDNFHSTYATCSTTTINDGVWHNIIGQKKVTGNTANLSLYIDGVLVNTHDDPAIFNSTNSANISIGNSGNGSYNAYDFKGSIDEVRIYNRALSPAEVRSLYKWAPSPIGHWKLDDHAGTSTVDSSGNGNTGTLTNGPIWTNGKFGSAVNFDGTNDYIDTSANNSLKGSSQFTISAWIKPSALDSLERDIYVEPRNADGSIRVQLAIASDNQLYFGVRAPDSGSSIQLIDDARSLSANTWQHVAAVYDSVNDVHYLYLNGIPVSASVSVPALDSTAPNSSPRIGSQIGSNYFKGGLDDIRIYNYARTQEQIIEDMNAGHPAGSTDLSTVGYWKFDEGSGTIANDSSGQGNNGTITNLSSPPTSTSGWTNNGKFGKALILDGTNDYVSITNTAPFNLQTFSASLWWYANGSTCGTTWTGPFNNRIASQNGFQFVNDTSSSTVFTPHLVIWNGTTETAQYKSTSTYTCPFTGWKHFIWTYDGTNTPKLYVDGIAQPVTTSATTTYNQTGVSIGRGYSYTTGLIDEVKVYPFPLTEDQIKIEYNQGKATVMGSKSTASDGATPSNSSSREYCVPGDTSTCNPPIGEWKFDEKNGVTANDTSGNGYNATITNPAWTQGKFASAMATNVNNTQEVATVSDPANGDLDFTGSDDLTYSMWVRSNDYSESPILLQKLQDRSGTTPGYDMLVSYSGGSNTLICELYDGTHSDSALFNSNNLLNDNKWHQATCVLDRNGSEMGTAGTYLFVDGKQVGSTSYTVTGSLSNARNLTMGESTSADLLNGAIDNAVIYKYARTRAQIAWDFNHGAPIDHYRFDECSGTTAYDSASNYNEVLTGNNGTITIGASGPNTSAGTCTGSSTEAWKNGANGKINSSLDFDGTDDIVAITNTSSIDFNEGLTNGFTVSGWIYPNSDGENDVGQFIYKNNIFYCATTSQSGSNLNMQCYLNLSTSAASIIVTNALTINTWNHFAVSWTNDSDDEISIWINGKYRGSSTNGSGNPNSDTSDFYIGGDNFGLANYDGKIDDLKIFNYELTSDQILNAYNGGSALQFAPITGSP